MAGEPGDRRILLGVHVTVHSVAVVLAGTAFAVLLGLAVLSWLENAG